ncbi:MAG: hypothetical protein EA402_00040, partial [Planctomycetota bacterium]
SQEDFAALARHIGDARGLYPHLIRTLAQSSPQAMAEHFFSDGWDLSHDRLESYWRDLIEDEVAARNGGEISIDDWFAWVGTPFMAQGPMLYDQRWLSRHYYDQLRAGEPHTWAERLRAVAWQPMDNNGKRELDRALGNIRSWISSRERDQERGNDVDPQHLAAIPELQEVLALFEDEQLGRPELAPHDMAANFARVMRARSDDSQDDFRRYGAALLENLASDLRQPLAHTYWAAILRQPGGDARAPELLTQAMETLSLWYRANDEAQNQGLWQILSQVNHRRDWSWRPRQEDRDEAVAVARGLAAGLRPHLNDGHLWSPAWNMLSNLRTGRGWDDRSIGVDEARIVVEKRLLPPSLDPQVNSAIAYIEMVREDFPALGEDFPYASAFDEMYIAEARQKNHLDPDYWRRGDDESGKVRQAAAEILAAYDELPVAGSSITAVYRTEDYWNLFTRIRDHLEGDARRQFLRGLERHVARRPDSWPLGRAHFSNQDLSEDSARAEYFAALDAYIDRSRERGRRLLVPDLSAIQSLGSANDPVLRDEELQVLKKLVDRGFSNWPSHRQGGAHALAWLLYDLEKREQYGEMLVLGPQLWRAVNDMDRDRTVERYVSFAQRMLEAERSEIAGAWAAMGLQVAGPALDASDRGVLEQVLNQARSQVAAVIPVDADDPRYGLFSAQAEWQVGRERGAWSTYIQPGNREALTQAVGELRPDFLVWLVSRHVELEEEEEAESLVRRVLTAFDRSSVPPPPDVSAELLYQRALLSLMRREFPQARAQMQFLTEVEEYAGTRQRLNAELMVADIDRETRNYESAQRILRQIARRPDPVAQARAAFYQSRLYADQDNWERALEEVQRGLELDPTMVDAKLLEAEILFEMRLYRAVEDIDVPGTARTRVRHIPGRPLT